MARPRAPDHDDKRQAILHHAAVLFAAHGYDRTSLTTLARACGISKALLYHYYNDKSELLFDIIHTHLTALLHATADPPPAGDPQRHLLALTDSLLHIYRTANPQHHVQISQMHLLPPDQQERLRDLERQLTRRFAAAIAACVPAPAQHPALLQPLTMSLFGMLNWNYLWFRDSGPLSRSDYAKLAVTLLLEGASKLEAIAVTPAPVCSRPG